MYPATIKLLFVLIIFSLMPSFVSAGKLSELFEKTSGSVVVLHTFEKIPSPSKSKHLTSMRGLGSGVLISDDGKILTAGHVVQVADSVHVEFGNDKRILAKVISSVPQADVALLQLQKPVPKGVVAAKLADSDLVKVGDDVFVIGAPYGISHTLTKGYISGIRSASKLAGLTEGKFFQTDAAINQGNSGGPMFNMSGEVVGIVSYILSQSGGFEGMGFAVTSNTAKDILINKRQFWAGIEGKVIDGRIAELLNIPTKAGILVERVADNSPAQRAGLIPGDLPAEIDGKRYILGGDIVLAVQGVGFEKEGWRDRFFEKIKDKGENEKFTVTVFRKGKKLLLTAPLK